MAHTSTTPLSRLEALLDALLPREDETPEALHAAMRHAVIGGGKRLRPHLTLAVAAACDAGEAEQELALLAACGVELFHCASLVHDDLPCFDDAQVRRGRPTVVARFGEATAVLTGDALLARGFEVLSQAPPELAPRALAILRSFGEAVGSRRGIIAGQSLELDGVPWSSRRLTSTEALIREYHAMKTAALFRAAAEAGAWAAGSSDHGAWGEVGRCIGLGYQLADDLYDAQEHTVGKPVGRDAALGRPNAVHLHGVRAASQLLAEALDEARARVVAVAREPAPVLAFLAGLHAQIGVLCNPVWR